MRKTLHELLLIKYKTRYYHIFAGCLLQINRKKLLKHN